MSLALGSFDVRPRGKGNLAPQSHPGCTGGLAKADFVVTLEAPVLEGPDDERPAGLDQRGEQRVLVRLSVHHVDGFRDAVELALDALNGAEPTVRLADPLVTGPLLLPDRLLEPEDCFDGQETEGPTLGIRAHGQREVPEEPLSGWLDQAAQARSLGLPAELELRRVV